DAADLLRRAVDLAPQHPGVLNNLAILYVRLDRWKDAIDMMKRAAELAPDELGLLGNLAWALATSPDPKARDGAAAARIAEDLCRRTSQRHPQALDTLAAACAELGRFDEAASAARRAIDAARAAGANAYAEEIRLRLKLYESNRPYRQPRAAPTTSSPATTQAI
ncbi:MAG: tetratricopeptide repeat protein, partial [Phycisphaerae bacterium]|nr:tetratricopeptide repeat protein [Phycisphaerae bacterium]